ncbi:unnamed protein product, partial [Prorocentrum cordatum]
CWGAPFGPPRRARRAPMGAQSSARPGRSQKGSARRGRRRPRVRVHSGTISSPRELRPAEYPYVEVFQERLDGRSLARLQRGKSDPIFGV